MVDIFDLLERMIVSGVTLIYFKNFCIRFIVHTVIPNTVVYLDALYITIYNCSACLFVHVYLDIKLIY